MRLSPDDTLIISFSYNIERENVLHINTCFDTFGMLIIYDRIKDSGLSISMFIPKCDRNTISQMIYLAKNQDTNVYVGKCTPIILNPSLMQTMQQVFEIKGITSAKKDIEAILNK